MMPAAIRVEIASRDVLPANSHPTPSASMTQTHNIDAGWMTRVGTNGVVVFNDRQGGTSIDDVSSVTSDDCAEDESTQDAHENEMAVADYQLQIAKSALRTAENDRITSANNRRRSEIGLEIAIRERDTAITMAASGDIALSTREIELECTRCRLATAQAELKFQLEIQEQHLLEARITRQIAQLNLANTRQALGSTANQRLSRPPPSATCSSPSASDIGSDSDLDE